MYGDVKKGDVSSGYGSMNSHNVYQHNGSKLLINCNDRDDMDMKDNLHNGDVISGIGLLKSHTLPQYNKPIKLNEMNLGVENGDINGGHSYMNSPTGSESKNHSPIDSTNKRD